MVTSAGLVAEVVEACRERLEHVDFQPRSGDIFTRPAVDDVLGWLGLNRAVGRGDGLVEINPVVGVRHQALEALIAELLGRKRHGYIPATLSSSIGYLMGDSSYRAWMFGGNVPVRDVAEELVSAVAKHGLPYMQRRSSLASIVESMASGEGAKELVAYRLPVGHLLLGDPNSAMDAIERSQSEIGTRQDLAAQRFRQFAAAFRNKLDLNREI